MSTDKADWGDRYLAAMRWAIPPAVRSQAVLLTRAQNVVNAAIIAGLFGPLYALAYLWLDFGAAARATLLCCLVMLSAPLVLRCSGSIVLARELFLGTLLLNFSWLSYHLGGIGAPTAPWLLTAPMVAMFLGGARSALYWLSLSCAALATLFAVQCGTPVGEQARHLPALHLLCCVGLLVVVTVFVLLFELTKTQGFVHLEQALRTINELAIRDELTGTHNRRHLIRLIERASERGQHFSLCLLDIDFFKHINDTWGHSAGDAVLRTFAQTVQSQVRPGDTFGRYGGEEFLLMLPDTGAASACILADRVRLGIEQMRCDEAGAGVAVTVSIGVAEFIVGETISQAIGRADEALYQAKSAGRNRVACHGDTVAQPPLADAAPMHLAGNDHLTLPVADKQADEQPDMPPGLLNRRSLRERLQQAMQVADCSSRPLALLLLKIDPVRELNASFGVAADDAVPVESGARIRAILRQGDAVAHWDGGQFIVVLEDVGDEFVARQVATKIVEGFAAPLQLHPGAPGSCAIRLAIGIALYRGAESSLDALLGHAELALARARARSGHSIETSSAAGSDDDRNTRALAIARAIVRIAHKLELNVESKGIAEALETQVQYQALNQPGCEPARGMLVHRPLHADAVATLLTRSHRVARRVRAGDALVVFRQP